MIYTIAGTDIKGREIAIKELTKLGNISTHIYSEQIAMLEPLISGASLFGEKIIVNLIQVMDTAPSRDELIKRLDDMKTSQNIFIIDEPFADTNRVNRLKKFSEKLFDVRVEKGRDVDVFTLCNLFAKKDKKGAWVEWMRIRDLDSPEAIHGALWWKFVTIWNTVRDGGVSKFTQTECEEMGGKLFRANILAHRGEKDLKTEMEAIILSL